MTRRSLFRTLLAAMAWPWLGRRRLAYGIIFCKPRQLGPYSWSIDIVYEQGMFTRNELRGFNRRRA